MGGRFLPFLSNAFVASWLLRCRTARAVPHTPCVLKQRKPERLSARLALMIMAELSFGNLAYARLGTESEVLLAAERYFFEAQQLSSDVRFRQLELKTTSAALQRQRRSVEERYGRCHRESASVEEQRLRIENLMRETEEQNHSIWSAFYPQVEAIRAAAERERKQVEEDHHGRSRGLSYIEGMKRYRDRMAEYKKRYFDEVSQRHMAYESRASEYLNAMDKVCTAMSDREFAQVLRDGLVAMEEVFRRGNR